MAGFPASGFLVFFGLLALAALVTAGGAGAAGLGSGSGATRGEELVGALMRSVLANR